MKPAWFIYASCYGHKCHINVTCNDVFSPFFTGMSAYIIHCTYIMIGPQVWSYCWKGGTSIMLLAWFIAVRGLATGWTGSFSGGLATRSAKLLPTRRLQMVSSSRARLLNKQTDVWLIGHLPCWSSLTFHSRTKVLQDWQVKRKGGADGEWH